MVTGGSILLEPQRRLDFLWVGPNRVLHNPNGPWLIMIPMVHAFGMALETLLVALLPRHHAITLSIRVSLQYAVPNFI